MSTIGKMEFTEKLAKELNATKQNASNFIDAFVKLVEQELKAGNEITLLGFGKFCVAQRKERMAINPQTKEKIKVPAKKAPAFKFSSKFKEVF